MLLRTQHGVAWHSHCAAREQPVGHSLVTAQFSCLPQLQSEVGAGVNANLVGTVALVQRYRQVSHRDCGMKPVAVHECWEIAEMGPPGRTAACLRKYPYTCLIAYQVSL